MIIPITNLSLFPYRARYKDEYYEISFSCNDIKEARQNKMWENRPFQSSLKELQAEWDSAPDVGTSIMWQRQYHVRRIATIIENQHWKEPLLLFNNRVKILDGGHRLWALHCLEKKEVDVIVINKATLTDDEKNNLWNAMAQVCGDTRLALAKLGIQILEP